MVEQWLFARQAEAMGIVVDEGAINDFLREITSNRVSKDKIVEALQEQRAGLSEPQLFAILKEELLALRLRELFHDINLNPDWQRWCLSIPPGQRWDYFKRLNRFAKVELVQVPVERFVQDVPDPDEGTLRRFFDEHKETVPNPALPEPGFHQPRKVAMQYLKAEQSKFLAAVTDAEIKAEYESKKELYDRAENQARRARSGRRQEDRGREETGARKEDCG